MSRQLRAQPRDITFQSEPAECSEGYAEPDLVEWLCRSLQGRGWVPNDAPWLWPVLKASLRRTELIAFLDRHQDCLETKWDGHCYRIRCVSPGVFTGDNPRTNASPQPDGTQTASLDPWEEPQTDGGAAAPGVFTGDIPRTNASPQPSQRPRSLSPPPDSADAVETQTTSLDTDVATQTEIVQMANRELQMALSDFVIVQPGDGANAQQPDGATASSADGASRAATCGGWRANDKGQWSKLPVGETQGPVAEVAAVHEAWSDWREGGGGRDGWAAGWRAGGGGPAASQPGHAGGGGLRALLSDGRRLRGP